MKIPKIFIYLSYLAGLLTILLSWQGITNPNTYKLETLNWATQAIGQDYINLFIAVPLLFISAYLTKQGSFKAFLVWLGLLLYLVYSYIIYAFFIHFSPLFLVYVAALSLSFYSLLGALVNINYSEITGIFKNIKVKAVSIFLVIIAGIFYFLWLSEIINALVNKQVPASLLGTGLITNPVHVLDLAFLLPGVLIVSQLLRQRKILGLILAVPIMLFLVVMGLAIISIMILMAPNFYSTLPQELMIFLIVLLNLFFIGRYFKKLNSVLVSVK